MFLVCTYIIVTDRYVHHVETLETFYFPIYICIHLFLFLMFENWNGKLSFSTPFTLNLV